jgi:hypothetical protein
VLHRAGVLAEAISPPHAAIDIKAFARLQQQILQAFVDLTAALQPSQKDDRKTQTADATV